MDNTHVDLLVIGWGKGGKTLARQAGLAGRTVAIIEQSREMVGGTCINIGCVPTKALVHDSRQRRQDDAPAEAFDRAVHRRDGLTAAMRAKNLDLLDTVDSVQIHHGTARFTGPRAVEVNTGEGVVRLTADAVVINTGAQPTLPDVPGLHFGGRVHDSTTIQHVSPLPEHIVVLGAGPIGLEFANLLAGFGSRVTLLNRGERILPREDDDVAQAIAAILSEAGVAVVNQATVKAVKEAADRVDVTWSDPNGEHQSTAGALLVATGRRATVDALGLEAAGVELDDRGFITVDDHLRTTAEGVYAVGDVNGGPQQTYISLDDSRIVADDLYGNGHRRTADRGAVPTVIFTTPPLARVGITVREARELVREHGRRVQVAGKVVADIAAMPRPKIEEDPRGLISFVVDADTDLVLGATLLHVGADEVINLVTQAMRHGITATQLQNAIYTHPSTTKALNEVLGELTPLS